MSHQHRFTAALAAALAAGAVVAPAGIAKPPDLNGPAPATAGSVQTQDLRTPDRRDNRDPGSKPYTGPSTAPFSGSASTTDSINLDRRTAVAPSTPSHSPSSSDGFEWGSAAAGAGAVLAIVLAGLGGKLAISRRRGAPGAKPTTVAAGH
jgi:hypothetical protein